MDTLIFRRVVFADGSYCEHAFRVFSTTAPHIRDAYRAHPAVISSVAPFPWPNDGAAKCQ